MGRDRLTVHLVIERPRSFENRITDNLSFQTPRRHSPEQFIFRIDRKPVLAGRGRLAVNARRQDDPVIQP